MLSIYKSPLMRAFFFYDYPFSTPTKNAVNKRIIERPISFPRRHTTPDTLSQRITASQQNSGVQSESSVISPSSSKYRTLLPNVSAHPARLYPRLFQLSP